MPPDPNDAPEHAHATHEGMNQSDYLALVQGVISRMANNSFVVKGWSVTLTAALLGFAAKDNTPSFAWIAAGATAVFGLLDARYLALERLYISKYESAAENQPAIPSLTPGELGFWNVVRALVSWSVASVHGVAVAAAVAVALFG